jgi:hypothetical protein
VDGLGEIIRRLEKQRGAIERALAALRDIEGAGVPVKRRGRPPGKKKRGGKRHMSAEARARIGEATRKRWAEKRAAEAAETRAPARKKRRLTAAGRKRLSDAMKARWASKNPPKAGVKKRAA